MEIHSVQVEAAQVSSSLCENTPIQSLKGGFAEIQGEERENRVMSSHSPCTEEVIRKRVLPKTPKINVPFHSFCFTNSGGRICRNSTPLVKVPFATSSSVARQLGTTHQPEQTTNKTRIIWKQRNLLCFMTTKTSFFSLRLLLFFHKPMFSYTVELHNPPHKHLLAHCIKSLP